MNKRMREILTKMSTLRETAKTYLDGENKDLEKFNSTMDQIDALQREYEAEARLMEAEKSAAEVKGSAFEPHVPEKKKELTSEQKMAKAIKMIARHKDLTSDGSMVESIGEDGGYTVPEDISTQIEHYAEANYSLLQEIDVVPVKTNKGSRTFQKKGTPDVFHTVEEMQALTDDDMIEGPKFERQNYTIEDRSGFMPISNSLLEDSDANITKEVTDWLGKANIATANKKILDLIGTKTAVDLVDLDGIKSAVVVTLGQAYAPGTKIYTNDYGLLWMDSLKSADGKYLLQPSPIDPMKKQLRCGSSVFPVEVLPKEVLANTDIEAVEAVEADPTNNVEAVEAVEAETRVPFIIGDLKAGIRKYDRKQITIKASDVASIGSFNAFSQNATLLCARLRDDYRIKDGDAFVNGYINILADPDGE